VAGLLSVLLSALHAKAMLGAPGLLATADPISASLFGLSLGQFIICACGALALSTEYGTGTIRTTLLAVPQRGRVLAAKTAVVAAAGFIWGLLTAAASWAAGYAILATSPRVASPDFAALSRTLAGAAAMLTALALLGFALAVLVHRTAAALIAITTLLFLAPTLLDPLSAHAQDTAKRYLPLHLAEDLLSRHPGPETLPVPVAAGWFALQLAILLCAGTALFRARDI